ncbi:MAG: glycoside hydrolase family 28 protein [Acidobacteriota bacterium]|nr:glycoside hydrolase family 28 protein [Acidobacteriota bacterium]
MPGELLPQAAHPAAHPRHMIPKASPPPLAIAAPVHGSEISGIYDVRTFGAVGDGKALDTPAVNRAIGRAAAAGGGTVRFPAGTYLCYSIHLKSEVSLYLDQGATILAAAPEEGGKGYDPPEPGPEPQYQDFGHSHWHNALIWGVGLENVSILGPGLIWGKGLRRSVGRNPHPEGIGDKAISLKNCHNVILRDFSILEGGHFGILATGVDNFTIDNLKIDTNRDGMDIDCCQNVRVTNCTVNSPWDDGICPKSSYALGYARPTKNLTISNCFVTGDFELGTLLDGAFKRFPSEFHVGRTGRIKCGTESNGGFQNITISNCVFDTCGGLALETVDGALLEDLSISNITMRGITNLPIFLRLGRRMRGPEGAAIGKLRRVNISNVVVSNTRGRYASILSGIPGHEIEDVKLSNIYILSEGNGTKEQAAIAPPEKEAGYPEPTMFGPMPAYGFYIRHVKGIEMSNIEVAFTNPDERPAFVLDQVEGADFVHVKAQRAAGVAEFALSGVKDVNVYLSRPVPETHIESAEKKSLG